ncbi:MAG: DUF1015 domain-containing protein [Bacteroidia bacterium]
MAKVKPFRGILPHPELVSDLMFNQFDHVILEKEKDITEEEIRLRAKSLGYNVDSEPELEYFLKVGIGYRNLIEKSKLLADKYPCYYLVGVNWENHWLYGIVGAVHYQDYWEGKVKKHEDTIEANESELVKITESIDFNFNPIMLAYPDHKAIDELVEQVALRNETYKFYNDANVEHKLWRISDAETIKFLEEEFTQVPSTYIADGHHRIESGSIVAKNRNEKGSSPLEAPHNYFVAIHFPSSQLRVYEFNRLIKDLGPYTETEFIEQVSHHFDVEKTEREVRPTEKFDYGMYIGHCWYKLRYKKIEFIGTDPVNCLDVSVLRKEIITGILGISNPRSTDRVSYYDGVRGVSKLVNLVNRGDYKVAFTVCPAKIEEMYEVANKHESMPPKATCIEPKLKSGMISRLLS